MDPISAAGAAVPIVAIVAIVFDAIAAVAAGVCPSPDPLRHPPCEFDAPVNGHPTVEQLVRTLGLGIGLLQQRRPHLLSASRTEVQRDIALRRLK